MYGLVSGLGTIGGQATVSVQNIVLGELVRQRGYGYQLQDRLRELFVDVFGFSETAVYPALQTLERRGLIEAVDRIPAHRGERWTNPRIVYEVTDEGRRRFHAWMAAPARKTPLREELHMKLMCAGPEDVPVLVDALLSVEAECRERLADVVARPLADRQPQLEPDAGFGAALVQDGVVSHLQATLAWAERSRAALEQLAATGGAGRTRP